MTNKISNQAAFFSSNDNIFSDQNLDFVLGSAQGPQLVLSAEYTTHDHREIITRAHCHDLSLDTEHFSALIKMSVRLHKAHGNANLRMMMLTKPILPAGVEED